MVNTKLYDNPHHTSNSALEHRIISVERPSFSPGRTYPITSRNTSTPRVCPCVPFSCDHQMTKPEGPRPCAPQLPQCRIWHHASAFIVTFIVEESFNASNVHSSELSQTLPKFVWNTKYPKTQVILVSAFINESVLGTVRPPLLNLLPPPQGSLCFWLCLLICHSVWSNGPGTKGRVSGTGGDRSRPWTPGT